MKVLVTGGSGRLGKYILRELEGRYELTNFDIVEPNDSEHEFVKGDITKLEDLEKVMPGHEAVIHLAAIPHPLVDPPEKVMFINTMGTFNALEAAAKNGVKKFIAATSDSALGFVFQEHHFLPEYIPIDEEHPLKPQDPYGLSKLINEETCKMYTRRYGMTTICLRPCFVWFPEEAKNYTKIVNHPDRGVKNLWVYIPVYDIARAFRLALEVEGLKHEVLFICVDSTSSPDYDTLDLLNKYYPGIKDIDPSFKGNRSVISSAKAERLLGFKAQHDWTDVVKSEKEGIK